MAAVLVRGGGTGGDSNLHDMNAGHKSKRLSAGESQLLRVACCSSHPKRGKRGKKRRGDGAYTCAQCSKILRHNLNKLLKNAKQKERSQ